MLLRLSLNHNQFVDDQLSERLANLESKIAHLELLADQLNEVVIGQGRELTHLKRKLDGQAQSLHAIELERIRETNPKPPHYE